MTPFITLEEHYISRSAVKKAGADGVYAMFPPHIVSKLADLGNERIADLEKGEVSLQVLSHGPIDASKDVCIVVNDELAAAISKNPTRLAGFALLPVIDPKAAADELDRCVTKLGFLGALVDNHLDGQFYDDEKFWPIFEKAEELDVPIYIHPTFASEEMLRHYKGNYDDNIALALSAFGWGWHSETGLHVLRLFASGLFDRYPKLKIVIGHMGEMLPFQLDRCVSVSERWGAKKRGLREVWQNNIWITTSGMFSLPPLACLLQTTTIDHVLYSVDYPFSPNEKGRGFIDVVKESGLMSEEDFEKFAYRNAENLLKVQATTGT
ncbi:putative 2-amino-3-carboxymuconate-6-semialdehyde decarboxylase [Leptodontidium sp. 2 PMI_412]|nr:putative 2-amino-3-carboxymuconate-6-semialdehyde decarboxylase [Leptodontidium sp. 2 PMI_412]